MPYTLHNDFDHNTAYGARCTACGNIKLKNHQGVFRPSVMDDVDGFHDICQECIAQAAHELGFIQPRVAKSLKTRIANLNSDLSEAQSMYINSQETIRSLCRENSNLQDELQNLTKSFEPELVE
tara:strand:- start:736 stop:1107 length:372 start_codon:yes stop_codon:yes gene_type:complete